MRGDTEESRREGPVGGGGGHHEELNDGHKFCPKSPDELCGALCVGGARKQMS